MAVLDKPDDEEEEEEEAALPLVLPLLPLLPPPPTTTAAAEGVALRLGEVLGEELGTGDAEGDGSGVGGSTSAMRLSRTAVLPVVSIAAATISRLMTGSTLAEGDGVGLGVRLPAPGAGDGSGGVGVATAVVVSVTDDGIVAVSTSSGTSVPFTGRGGRHCVPTLVELPHADASWERRRPVAMSTRAEAEVLLPPLLLAAPPVAGDGEGEGVAARCAAAMRAIATSTARTAPGAGSVPPVTSGASVRGTIIATSADTEQEEEDEEEPLEGAREACRRRPRAMRA